MFNLKLLYPPLYTNERENALLPYCFICLQFKKDIGEERELSLV